MQVETRVMFVPVGSREVIVPDFLLAVKASHAEYGSLTVLAAPEVEDLVARALTRILTEEVKTKKGVARREQLQRSLTERFGTLMWSTMIELWVVGVEHDAEYAEALDPVACADLPLTRYEDGAPF